MDQQNRQRQISFMDYCFTDQMSNPIGRLRNGHDRINIINRYNLILHSYEHSDQLNNSKLDYLHRNGLLIAHTEAIYHFSIDLSFYCQFNFILILRGEYSPIQLIIYQMNQPRVRKDYRALTTSQRARFFHCLKLLGVLPPREKDNLRNFYIPYTNTINEQGQTVSLFKQIKPQNIHDQLIASHQTSCQHHTIYFPYYHRHLVICIQIALNYAEQVLIAKTVPDGKYQLHPKQWDAVFNKYQQIIAAFRKQKGLKKEDPLPQLSLHYWNATDYSREIQLPIQLKKKQHLEQIDVLYFAVNKHYAWDFNFRTRWFNNQPIDLQQFKKLGYFSEQPAQYNQFQQGILSGANNPRNNPGEFLDYYISYDQTQQKYINQLFNKMAELNAYKNYLKLNQTATSMDVTTLQTKQINTAFGNQHKRLQWITQTERQQIIPEIYYQNAYIYNKFLPHFQYANALLTDNVNFVPNYVTMGTGNIQKSMQNCHNTIHNSLHYFMKDPLLSITNLLFFIYHSWVDLALETKIRRIRTSDKNQQQLEATVNYLNLLKEVSILNQPPSQNFSYGDYYIYQWRRPDFKDLIQLQPSDYQAAFQSRDYYLKEGVGLRRSDQLNDFYKQNYVPQNRTRYQYFKGFQKFVYDYDYEIYEYKADGQPELKLMSGANVPIPQNIQAIGDDYGNIWNNNLTRAIRQFSAQTQMPKTGLTSFSSLPKQIKLQNANERKQLLKTIQVTLLGYAQCKSAVESTILPISLQLTQKGIEYLKSQLKAHHLKSLNKGIVFTSLPIYARGQITVKGSICKPYFEVFLACSEQLAQINPELYCRLIHYLNRKIIYEIIKDQQTQIQPTKISDFLRLNSCKKTLNALKLLEGAIEVSFKINFHNKEEIGNSSIKINGFSYSVESDNLVNISNQKKQNLNCEIFLNQLIGINERSGNNRYVYKKIKVFLKNGILYKNFQFNINTYHELVRYEIDIYQRETENGRTLDVTVRDRDYAFKKDHFALNH